MFHNSATNYNIKGLCALKTDGELTVIAFPIVEIGYCLVMIIAFNM